MSAPHETSFQVFYSWQSESPEETNLSLIRQALSEAATHMNADKESNLHVKIDEATRETSGSPNIVDSIFTKIRMADAFVCDLTKVAELPNLAGTTRKYCNPNAAIELGYAAALLGWSRIILVFNEAYGVIPDDLPFDVRAHRVTRYRCERQIDDKGKLTTASAQQIASQTGNLRETLKVALKLIAKMNPARPDDVEPRNPDSIKRERDVEQLQAVFHWLHLDTLRTFESRLAQGRLTILGHDLHDFFKAHIESIKYHLHDVELDARIKAFAAAWSACCEESWMMSADAGSREIHFDLSYSSQFQEQRLKAKSRLEKQGPAFRAALDSLLQYVREQYIEIDVTKTGTKAVAEYYEIMGGGP